MATQTTDQQNALKDAMARAKQIAAKLQQHGPPGESPAPEPEENRKRLFNETANHPNAEPASKRNAVDGVDHTDPKVIAQQIANSLVQRAGLGSMLVEEVSIPNRLVGLVIGRGGEMINKLQSESGAKIQVAPDPPPNFGETVENRQITITGTSEAVSKAKLLIGEIRNGGKVPERLMGGTLPGEFSIEMNIATGKVGLVIGKGGETIKSLQERAGCKMVLFQDGQYMDAPEKPLRISGEQSTVMYGKQLVQDLLTQKELEHRDRRGNWGQGGDGQNGPGGPRPGWGGAPGQQGGPGGGGPRNWTPGGRPFSRGHGSDGNSALQPGHKHMIIQVPANKCGLVIGKGGETIKFIHSETKVNIEINRDVQDTSPFRTFQVRGTDEMIDKALSIIREKINDPSIMAKSPSEGNDSSPAPNQWGAPQGGGWQPPQQQNQQWNPQQQNQWPGQQPGFGQQPGQPEQWNQQGQWGGQPQPGAPGWNQPQQPPQQQQPQWDPQQQQWQQPNAAPQGQWPNQQMPWNQPGQPYQPQAPQNATPAAQPNQPAPNPAGPGDPAQAAQAGGQPDYSAAWALYYQQQSQYYQQYAMQQPVTAAPGVTGAPTSTGGGAPIPSQTSGTPTSANNPQAQAMADYQAKLAEYYKSFGQQPP